VGIVLLAMIVAAGATFWTVRVYLFPSKSAPSA
jgi:hypothetical protein